MTLKECAAKLGVTEKTVMARIKAGEIQAKKVGKVWVILETTSADEIDYRKLKMEMEAKLKELQYKVESGDLVSATTLRGEYAKALGVLNQQMENLHHKIIARLASEDKSNWLLACRDEIDRVRNDAVEIWRQDVKPSNV